MKLRFLFALLVFQVGFAQQRTCGTQEIRQELLQDPVKKQAYMEKLEKLNAELQNIEANKGTHNRSEIIRIPVAVHFPSVSTTASSTTKTCLRNLAQTQINVLNADYNAANSDISNWENDASYYPMVTSVGKLNVEFVLATQNHPAEAGIAEGTTAVTFGTDFLGSATSDVTWSGYLNFVVKTLPGGLLGLSPNLGASPANGDCVFIAPKAFGTGSGCVGYVPAYPFNLGRTLTHELGHYLQLEHPFYQGCASTPSTCSTTGDYVCDTPAEAQSAYDCPIAGEIAGCVNGEYVLSMNFMDYVNDACMYMFTLGQENRMRAWFSIIAEEFKTEVLANDSFLQKNFSVYPNPNKGSFTIEFKEFTESYAVEVFDVTGQVIYDNNYSQNSDLIQVVDLGKVTKGVYFIAIKSDKGLVTKKIVVD